MRKNVLAQSIATMIGGLCLAGTASAAVLTGAPLTAPTATTLQVAEGGVGHSLLVPYFNAQNGNMSVFHVVNTDQANGKAIKVRFRSAANSDDILDFQVFLSPGDVWTAAVSQGSDGRAEIKTYDNTCTVPALTSGVGQPFVTDRLDTRLTADQKANQTREGYVEVFTMADVPKNTTAGSLYNAIKHVNGVAPCSVAGSAARTLLDTVATTDFAASTDPEDDAVAAGFQTPTTGLAGDWYIINVPQTTTFSGAATSIVAVDGTGAAGRANFVHFPQNDTVITGVPNNFTADPLFRTANVADNAGNAITTAKLDARNYDLPDMSTPYATAPGAATAPLDQAALLTNALAVTSITNQYANDTSITAKTDWVFSMPTRRYSVAANYAAANYTADDYRLFSEVEDPDATIGWFRRGLAAAGGNTSLLGGLICVTSSGQTFYDREERTPGVSTPGPIFSPGTPSTPTVPRFCGETSVLQIGDAGTSVLGATVAMQSVTSTDPANVPPYKNGWSVVTTPNNTVANAANPAPGLPILGAAFIKLTNPNVGSGVSGNFGITWPHRFTR